MYNYFINFQPVLLGAPLTLGALSARLVRLWVNPALPHAVADYVTVNTKHFIIWNSHFLNAADSECLYRFQIWTFMKCVVR